MGTPTRLRQWQSWTGRRKEGFILLVRLGQWKAMDAELTPAFPTSLSSWGLAHGSRWLQTPNWNFLWTPIKPIFTWEISGGLFVLGQQYQHTLFQRTLILSPRPHKHKVGSLPYTIYKNYSEWIKDLNVTAESINGLEEIFRVKV